MILTFWILGLLVVVALLALGSHAYRLVLALRDLVVFTRQAVVAADRQANALERLAAAFGPPKEERQMATTSTVSRHRMDACDLKAPRH